jgi:hypothetical protein
MIASRVQVSHPKCTIMNEAFHIFTSAYPGKRGCNTANMTPNTSFQKPVRLPAGAENVLISTPSRLHSLLTKPYQVLFCRWYSRSGMNLTTHLIPRLQMPKIYLHLTYSFTLWWSGTDCGEVGQIVVKRDRLWWSGTDCGEAGQIVVKRGRLWWSGADCGEAGQIVVNRVRLWWSGTDYGEAGQIVVKRDRLWWSGTDLTLCLTASFPVLSTPSFTNLLIVRRYVLWATGSVVKWNISKQTHGMAEQNRQSVYRLGYLLDNLNLSAIPGMGRDFFLFCRISRRMLGPTQSPIQWVPTAVSPGIKEKLREDFHSTPPSVEVRNEWSPSFTPPIAFPSA